MSKEHTGLPNTPEEIRAFIGKSFSSLQFGQDNEQPHENDTYTLTAHDLISAFQWSEIDAPVSAEPVAHRLLRRNSDGEWVHDAKHWVNGWPPPELIRDCGQTPELYRIEVAYAAPVAAQSDLTQQTLDDVMAGIPARDAEIAALQKENLALLHRAAIDAEVASRLARRLFEISAVISPDTPIAQHDISDLLARVKRVVSTLAQQVDKSPETQEKTVDKSPDLQGHASVIFAKAVAWADARVDAALTQPEQEGYESACDDADQAHYELVQALRNLREAQQPVSGAGGLRVVLEEIHDWMDSQADAQSKGCHATFDLMILRELRDKARAALDHLPDATEMVEPSVGYGEFDEDAEFMSWLNATCTYDDLNKPEIELAKDAWQARAALAQQDAETGKSVLVGNKGVMQHDAEKVQADLLNSLVEIVDAVIASDEEGLIEHSETIIKARAAIDAARKEAAHG